MPTPIALTPTVSEWGAEQALVSSLGQQARQL